MLELERLPQKRIGVEVDLAHRKIVCRTPVGVDLALLFGREWRDRPGDFGGRRGMAIHRRVLPTIRSNRSSKLLVQKSACLASVWARVVGLFDYTHGDRVEASRSEERRVGKEGRS